MATTPGGPDSANPPVPDPTVLTTEALIRAVAAERDYVDGQLEVLRERLRGIDRATTLLSTQMTEVPSDVDKQVGHLKELTDARFVSIDGAVAAALTTQKESIAKTEQLTDRAVQTLSDKIDDDRVAIAELRQLFNGAAQNKAGGTEQRTEHRSQLAANWGALAGVAAAAVVVLGIIGLIITIISTSGSTP